MRTLTYSAAIIKPKGPFIKWAKWAYSIHADREESSEFFKKDFSVILMPQYITNRESRAYINTIWEDIFEEELRSWYIEESLWPRDRTQKLFWLWFGVEFHYEVFDSQ